MQSKFLRSSLFRASLFTLAAAHASAQLSWTQLPSSPAPTARFGHQFAQTLPSGHALLFGGTDGTQCFGDTWRFTGATSTWQLVATEGPAPRHEHAQALHHHLDESVLLFGGRGAQGELLGDTWIWHGVAWLESTTAVAPSARAGHALAVDERLERRLVMFGGRTASGLSDETWVWDTDHWTQVFTAHRPPAREGHVLVYEPNSLASLPTEGGMLLNGGRDDAGVFRDEWTFDGRDWRELPTSLGDGRSGHAFAASYRDRFVTFGGDNGQPQANTSERKFDGGWLEHATLGSPSARSDGALIVESPFPDSFSALLFGGRDAQGAALGDTWRLQPTAYPSLDMEGESCGPGPWGLNDGPFLWMTSAPLLGNDMWLFVLTASSNTSVLVSVGDVMPESPFGACKRRVLPQLLRKGRAEDPDSIGFGTFATQFPIPFDANLRGSSLGVQAFAREPLAANGIAVSRLTRLTLAD